MRETSSTKCGCPGAAATDDPSVCTHINAEEARDKETRKKVLFTSLISRVNDVNVTHKKTKSSEFDVFLTVHHSRLLQITNLMHNSFILQQYVCYTTILNMFRAALRSSSGGQIVSPQPLVSSPSVNSRTVCSW